MIRVSRPRSSRSSRCPRRTRMNKYMDLDAMERVEADTKEGASRGSGRGLRGTRSKAERVWGEYGRKKRGAGASESGERGDRRLVRAGHRVHSSMSVRGKVVANLCVTSRGATSVWWRGWGFRGVGRIGAKRRRGARRGARGSLHTQSQGEKRRGSRARWGGRRRDRREGRGGMYGGESMRGVRLYAAGRAHVP